ncbi:MAG: DUF72 domain-containing protein [Candidatus Jordarchaeum sp.]|uniref:DUF72 domain-containing protein n=1 Tax=Candidatus Jordarchaeum sp. TaxID=2823881 RepID=UPI00404B3BD1
MIKVGCCGFPGGIDSYFRFFKLTEVQRTFYKPPSEETLKKWREKAPSDFEFSIKAWQFITHNPKSPTYKKAGINIPDDKKNLYGSFKPTTEVLEAWEKTSTICNILRAKICLFQCPVSFIPSEENIKNMKEFFSTVNRSDLVFVWEPRGKDWAASLVKDLCEELDITHVVDPFASNPTYLSLKTAYLRLHGSPPGEKTYAYKYSDEDLLRLRSILQSINAKQYYLLFNNISMKEDALRFYNIISEDKHPE